MRQTLLIFLVFVICITASGDVCVVWDSAGDSVIGRVEYVDAAKLAERIMQLNAAVSMIGMPPLVPVSSTSSIETVQLRQRQGSAPAFLITHADGTTCCIVLTNIHPLDPDDPALDHQWYVGSQKSDRYLAGR